MQQIILPVHKSLIIKELKSERFVRKTNYGNNEIYIINAHNSPNVMREIGRLRELTFRYAGGGTGKDVDIDSYDTNPIPYEQLIVWSPTDQEIVGGYRFIKCKSLILKEKKEIDLVTTHLFKFSDKFISDFLPYTIELGRSFVQPNYQPSSTNRNGLFSLDNIWDGLGALTMDNPDIQYFFGKVTMYLSFNQKARDLILFFMHKFFPDREKLVFPHNPLSINSDLKELDDLFCGNNYQENYKILNSHVRNLNENIPPLVNTYMNISPSMRTFGTSLNDSFGQVEETGILVTIKDIYESKKERHLLSYKKI
ncbi:MAG: GNAT family N-acetyltransferase [Bacteroidetes bacterium]|nr:GNAT family N-acetyltransferase [Bacteroidota bacterium]